MGMGAKAYILTVNGGSSSVKFALFEASDSPRRVLEGRIERMGLPQAAPDHTAAVQLLMDWLEEQFGRDRLTAVGHRVVPGGPKHGDPQRITPEMVRELRQLSPFDPERLPEETLLTEAFHGRFPDLPQVAFFDTAFHYDMPRVAHGCCRSRAATVFTVCPAPI
jgi:acetate kinase